MIRFHGGFISGQTGDMGKKPETEDGDVQKFQKVEKWMSQKSKIGIIGFPCGSWI